jgi:hypothetical protein
MGRKTPVETKPSRRGVPACQNAILRDEPPSKRCVSTLRFCSAAMASKLTGSAAAMVATVLSGSSEVGGWIKIDEDNF